MYILYNYIGQTPRTDDSCDSILWLSPLIIYILNFEVLETTCICGNYRGFDSNLWRCVLGLRTCMGSGWEFNSLIQRKTSKLSVFWQKYIFFKFTNICNNWKTKMCVSFLESLVKYSKSIWYCFLTWTLFWKFWCHVILDKNL